MPDSDLLTQDLFTWKLTVAYDGTEFRGWQIQPGEPTIQGELQGALGRVTGEAPLPQGSGRTDAGVHALAQVASFGLHAPIPSDNLQHALNRTLPSSIRILDARRMSSDFHARHSATAKTYEYRVWVAESDRNDICSPFLARYVYAIPWPLDLSKLDAAAQNFVGDHDFLSFAASDPDLTTRNLNLSEERPIDPDDMPSSIRTIFSSTWDKRATENGALLIYRVRGNGFLHHMVRNIVGTMLDVGRGHLEADVIPAIFMARKRSAAGPTAPARGLFLHSVEYDAANLR